MSIEPLREYFDVLRIISLSPNISVDQDSVVDGVKVKALIDEQCLLGVDVSTIDGTTPKFEGVCITPHGAVVLAEWSSILERESFKFKFMLIVERFIWVFVGILSTVASDIVKLIVT